MRAIGWRLKAGALGLFALVVAIAAVVLADGSSSADSSPTAAHRALAAAATARLLDGARLPGGARVMSTSGVGTPEQSLRLIDAPSAPNVAVHGRRWSVAEPPARVAAFLRAHPPAGTHQVHASGSEVVFAVDRRPAGLAADGVAFMLSRGDPGSTTVRATATATWVVARPASELVPAAAHVVDVYRARPGHAASIALKVTDPQYSAIRRLIDALPTVQPGVVHCPAAVPGLSRVSFVFRAHEGGPALATASEDADVVAPTTACDPLAFAIGGHAGTPLLGGAPLLREVSRIVGHRLRLAPYAA